MKNRGQSCRMHRFFIAVGIILAYTLAILNTVAGQKSDLVHVCCYSSDPSQYPPNCYDCDAMVYKNALTACLNMTDLPKNISYKAATCMEKNCAIQPPKVSEAENVKKFPLYDAVNMLMQLYNSNFRPKRSIHDNKVGGSKAHYVKEVSTLVSRDEATMQFTDPEYM